MAGRKRKEDQEFEVKYRTGKRSKPSMGKKGATGDRKQLSRVAINNNKIDKRVKTRDLDQIPPGHQFFGAVKLPEKLTIEGFGNLFDAVDLSTSLIFKPTGLEYFLAVGAVVLESEENELDILFSDIYRQPSPMHPFAHKVQQQLKVRLNDASVSHSNMVRTIEKLLSNTDTGTMSFKFWKQMAIAGLTSLFIIKLFACRPENELWVLTKGASEAFECLREKKQCLYSCFAYYEKCKASKHCNEFDWAALEKLHLEWDNHKKELTAFRNSPNLKVFLKGCNSNGKRGKQILDFQPAYIKVLQEDVKKDSAEISKLEIDRNFHIKTLNKIEEKVYNVKVNQLEKVQALEHLRESSVMITETKLLYHDLLALNKLSTGDYTFLTFSDCVIKLLMTDKAQEFLSSEMMSIKNQCPELAILDAKAEEELRQRLLEAKEKDREDNNFDLLDQHKHQSVINQHSLTTSDAAAINDVLKAAMAQAGIGSNMDANSCFSGDTFRPMHDSEKESLISYQNMPALD